MNKNDVIERNRNEIKICSRFLTVMGKKWTDLRNLFEQQDRIHDDVSINTNEISSHDRKLIQPLLRALQSDEKVVGTDKAVPVQPAEMKLLMSYRTYLMYSTIFGMTTFILIRLRRSRGNLISWNKGKSNDTHINTNMHSQQHHVQNSPFTRTTTSGPSRSNNITGNQSLPSFIPDHVSNSATQKNQGILRYVIGWTVDFMLSVGIMSIYFWSQFDLKNYFLQLSKIPLVEGPSYLSLVLCPFTIIGYEQVQKEIQFSAELLLDNTTESNSQYDNTTNNTFGEGNSEISVVDMLEDSTDKENVDYNDAKRQRQIKIVSECWNKPQTVPLLFLHEFCHNCRKRIAYEKLLLRQNHDDSPEFTSGGSGIVNIPPPGVPNDFVIETNPEGYDDNDEHNDTIDNNDKHSEKVTLQDIKWIFQ